MKRMNPIFKKIDWLAIIFVLGFIVFILSGCKKETIEAPSPSLNYFPTSKGIWIEYSVDSIYHSESDNQNDDSVEYYHFERKEIIDSSFFDGSNQLQQIIYRFERPDAQSDWGLSNVWTQKLTLTSAYRTENNISIHKLAFPINSDMTWNGNDANSSDEEIYYYEYFNEPANFNSIDFDSTLSVIQVDEDNYIEKLLGREIYAAGIGLIYREVDNLTKINGIIVGGYEVKMEITAYGSN